MPNFWWLATTFVYKTSKYPFGKLIFMQKISLILNTQTENWTTQLIIMRNIDFHVSTRDWNIVQFSPNNLGLKEADHNGPFEVPWEDIIELVWPLRIMGPYPFTKWLKFCFSTQVPVHTLITYKGWNLKQLKFKTAEPQAAASFPVFYFFQLDFV